MAARAQKGRIDHKCHLSAIPHLDNLLSSFSLECSDTSSESLIMEHHKDPIKSALSLWGFLHPLPCCFLDGKCRKSYFSSFGSYQVDFLVHREPPLDYFRLSSRKLWSISCLFTKPCAPSFHSPAFRARVRTCHLNFSLESFTYAQTPLLTVCF